MCTESITNFLLDRESLVIFGLDYVYPGLILVHRVQNEL